MNNPVFPALRLFMLCLLLAGYPGGVVFGVETGILQTEEDIAEAWQAGEIPFETYQVLVDLIRVKVDINSDEVELLTLIPGIDQVQVEQIQAWQEKTGYISERDYLKKIPDLDYARLAPFITVKDIQLPLSGITSCQVKQYLAETDQLETETRICLQAKDHITVEGRVVHSATDQILWKNRSLAVTNISYCKKMVVGDYRTFFGHKLVLGGDYNLGITNTDRYINLPATEEAKLEYISNGSTLDGVLVNLGIKDLRGTFCYSSKDLFVYTAAPYQEKSRDRLYGSQLEYTWQGITVGMSGISSRIKVREATTPLQVWGAHSTFRKKGLLLFGESAWVRGKGKGLIAGGRWQVKQVWTKAIYRHYGEKFYNFYSRGMADADGDDNDADEKGWLVRTDFNAFPRIKCWGYYDFWRTISTGQEHFEREGGVTYAAKESGYVSLSLFDSDEIADQPGQTKRDIRFRGGRPLFNNFFITGELKYRHAVYSTMDIKDGGFTWLGLEMAPRTGWKFKGKLKYTNYDISQWEDGYWRLYLTEEITIMDNWRLAGYFTHTAYNDPSKPSLNQIRMKLTLKWE